MEGRTAAGGRLTGTRACVGLVASLLLAGCAQNTLRLEGAAAVGTAAAAFTATANVALDDARIRRAQANATLVASDPSCEPLAAVNILLPPTDRSRVKNVPLCADGRRHPPGYTVQPLDLRPISEEALRPTVLLIGALGDYGAALAKVAARPKADVGKDLTALAAKAGQAAALANGLAGSDIPDAAKALATDQAKSAVALIQFALDLADEQAKVRDVARLVDSRGDTVVATVPEIRAQLAAWILVSAQGDAQVVQNNLLRAYRGARARMTYEQRLAMATTINQARADQLAYPRRAAALGKGLDEFVAAERGLRRLLRGEFTGEERRRLADINGRRMIEALGLMARAVSAFGGL